MSAQSLAAAIAGEEAATYAYGVAAPWLQAADRDIAIGGLAAHRARVLILREAADDAGESGAPGGFVTGPVDSPQAARSLLAEVEARLAGVYADLAADTTDSARRDAVLAACECSARSVSWGGATAAFPGRADG